jgi:hypothetical protein
MSDWKVKGRQVTVTDDQGTVTANMTPAVICDIRIPFWRLVFFMIKYFIAFIPALIIISFVFGVIVFVIGAVLGLAGIIPMPQSPPVLR